jgi:hypothetical protein
MKIQQISNHAKPCIGEKYHKKKPAMKSIMTGLNVPAGLLHHAIISRQQQTTMRSMPPRDRQGLTEMNSQW